MTHQEAEIYCKKIINKKQHPGELSFHVENQKDPIVKLCANGDIYVKGKLIENDLELVEGMREFLKRAKL